MRIGPFEFNLRELAGSMGDFGTLLPLVIGSVALNMAVGFAAGMILHYLVLGRPEESDDEE